MKLSPQQKLNPLWLEIEADLKTRLAQLRERGDRRMSEQERSELVGQITEVKLMLAWGKEQTVEDVQPDPMRA